MSNILASRTNRLVITGIFILGMIFVWHQVSQRYTNGGIVDEIRAKPFRCQPYENTPEYSATTTRSTQLQNCIQILIEEGSKAPSLRMDGLQQEIRSRILPLPKVEVVLAILDYLESGRDAPTGTNFIVGPGGFLTEAPTVRTFLLDVLAELDSQSAAKYSDKIFAEARNADEWALAMRNIARHLQDNRRAKSLLYKFGEMVGRSSWRKNPTGGFLEAFDIPVYFNDQSALLVVME